MPETKKSTNSSTSAAARKTSNKKVWKALGIGTGVAALGFGAYWFLLGPGMAKKPPLPPYRDDNPAPMPLPPPSKPTSSGGGSSWTSDDNFPLRQGMRGERVRLLQAGLNRQFSSGLTTDGMWGPKTQAALSASNVPSPISETAWRQMLQFLGKQDPYHVGGSSVKSGSAGKTPGQFAQNLAVAKAQRDFSGAKMILGKMQTAQDYKNVSDAYKKVYSRSVVDAMLGSTSPWSPSQKSQIRTEFKRMGLTYNRILDRWSLPGGLSGIVASSDIGLQAVTIRPTSTWNIHEVERQMPAGVSLGIVIERGVNLTAILTPGGEELFVSTTAVAVA